MKSKIRKLTTGDDMIGDSAETKWPSVRNSYLEMKQSVTRNGNIRTKY